ncbi:MAG: hypothetical protein KatS3mg013_1192 [Actinomycetota bacterium]|nr:MAG: hypothetical protein KatS3mg013_1192 [Actinomycetota bacterium]
MMADSLRDPRSLGEDELVAYLVSLPAHGRSRREWLKAVQAFWRWWSHRSEVPDPSARLRLRAPVARPPDILTPEQVRALVRAAFRAEERRGWAVLLQASTGLCIGSLVALRREDVHPEEGWLWTTAAKGGRMYRVELSRPARIAAAHLLAIPPRGQARQQTLLGVGHEAYRRWLRRAAESAGLGRVWPHLLRHTFGSALAAVADPRSWQAAMGHTDLSQYARYAHPDARRVAAAVEAARVM